MTSAWENLGRSIDRSWPIGILVLVGAGVTGAYGTYAYSSDEPVLLGRIDATTRGIFYGSISASAGALLGLTIASIAILLTLDERRERVRDMRSLRAWRTLNATLLTAALFCALTLLMSTVALAVDSGEAGCTSLEIAVVALSAIAFCELVVGGLAFAIVVVKLTAQNS